MTTSNQQTVASYMEGFRRDDHARILACLTDDVEWLLPGAFHSRGKAEFAQHIVGECFVPGPEIVVARTIEAGDVVVAEGTVRTRQHDGAVLDFVFCDVFEMVRGRIRKLTSYLMPAQ
jgi:uncharacterized protein